MANSEEGSNVLNLLFDYESTFGQKVNKDKMTIFFSKSVTEATRQIIKGVLGFHEIKH